MADGPWTAYAAPQPVQQPVAQGPWTAYQSPADAAPAPKPSSPLMDKFFDQTSMGQILHLFGQGAAQAWGAEPLGFSPETVQALRDHSIFRDTQKNLYEPFKAFNEALMRGAAWGLDAASRVPAAIAGGETAIASAISPAVGKGVQQLLQAATDPGLAATLQGFGPVGEAAGDALAVARPSLQRVLSVARDMNVIGPGGEAAWKGTVPPPEGSLVKPKIAAEAMEATRPAEVAGQAAAPAAPAQVIEQAARDQTAGAVARIDASVGPMPPVNGETIPLQEAPATPSQRAMAAEMPTSPHTLYEDPPSGVVDSAGNINLDRINAADDVKQVIREVADQTGGSMDARRAPMSFGQIEDLAAAQGMSAEDLLKRQKGEAFNAEQAVAARNLLVQSANNVRDLAIKAASGSEADVLAFQQAMTRHMAIQEQVAGMTAEAGRALSSFNIKVGEARDAGQIADVAKELTGRSAADVAAKVRELDTPEKVSKFLMDSRKPTFLDMAQEYWMNALLSGPLTHAVYAASNVANALLTVPETGIAAAISKAREIATGADEGVRFGEAGARLYGLFRGIPRGIVAAWQAIKSGQSATQNPAIAAARMKAIPGPIGEVVRTPSRVVHGLGDFYYTIGYQQELQAQAWRAAAKEGGSVGETAARAAELAENPTPAMMEAAKDNGEYQNFTQKLGRIGAAVTHGINMVPGARFVLPFLKVPANIVKYAVERSPLGLAMSEVRDNLSGVNGQAAQDTQMARMAFGTSVGLGAMSLAAQGLVTGGGPSTPAERAALRLTGWQSYSVRIGDQWYGYHRTGSWGFILGMYADWYEAHHMASEDENKTIAGAMFAATAKNLTETSWLQGPAHMMQAVEDPDRYGDRYVQQLAASFAVPTGFAQAAHEIDPVIRQTQSTLDAIKARTPYLSESLLPRRDIWGEPLTYNDGGLGTAVPISRVSHDPVNQELISLGVFPAPVEKTIRGVKLNPQQYDDLQRISGRLSKLTLDGQVNMPGWQELPPFARREIIKNTLSRTRETARNLVMMENPDIIGQAMNAKAQQIAGKPLSAQPVAISTP